MDDHTFQSRVATLAQKCRKAVRLYTSMGRMQGTDESDSDRQIQVWKEINSKLLDELVQILEHRDRRLSVVDAYSLRDRYYTAWRNAEAEVHRRRRSLIEAAENGDFNKCALVSRDLVLLKAQQQANQAVHHELQELLEKSRLTRPERSDDDDPNGDDSPLLDQAKVIPLRRRRS